MRSTSKATVAKARLLRRHLTEPEARLWQTLRTRPDQLKFRKQHPIGPYVVDFYCAAAKLVIESAATFTAWAGIRFAIRRGIGGWRAEATESCGCPRDICTATSSQRCR